MTMLPEIETAVLMTADELECNSTWRSRAAMLNQHGISSPVSGDVIARIRKASDDD